MTSPERKESTEVIVTSGLGVSDQSLSYASWLLHYMAENLEYYLESRGDSAYSEEYYANTSLV